MKKELKDYTITELKALVYDNLSQIELSNNNIKLLNQELLERNQLEVSTEENKEEEK